MLTLQLSRRSHSAMQSVAVQAETYSWLARNGSKHTDESAQRLPSPLYVLSMVRRVVPPFS